MCSSRCDLGPKEEVLQVLDSAVGSVKRIMKLSARNVLKGKVVKITQGAVNSVVVIEIGPGLQLTSVVTGEAVRELGLAKGKGLYAIIKAPNVMLGLD